jgi:type VI protein secretion system component Hcp
MSSKWFMMELPGLLADGHSFKSAIDSFQLEDTTRSHSSAVANGNTFPHRVEISRIQDKYSPVFFSRSMAGKGFVEMTLTVLTFDNGSMISRVFYNFSDLMLEAYVPRNSGLNKAPVETLKFNYEGLNIGP